MSPVGRVLATLRRALTGIVSRWRNLYFRALGVRIEGYAWLRKVSIPRNFDQITLGGNVALDDGVVLLAVGGSTGQPKIVIGSGTYVNRYTMLDASQEIRIGRGVGIGPGCYITDHDHRTRPGTPFLEQALAAAPTVIGDGVWLGAGVIVLKGVSIGENSVVAAGSVVARSLPANVVAGGQPARPIRRR
jgi:acetyltransferase-like isoleucine patch superfamily enzyme